MYTAFVAALLSWALFVTTVFDFRKPPVVYQPMPEPTETVVEQTPEPVPTLQAKPKKAPTKTPAPTIQDNALSPTFNNDALIQQLIEKNKNAFPMTTQVPPENPTPAPQGDKEVTLNELNAGVVWQWANDDKLYITISQAQAGDHITLNFNGSHMEATVDKDNIRGRDKNWDFPPIPVEKGKDYPFIVKIKRGNEYTEQSFIAKKSTE